MIYRWYYIFNIAEFEALGLVSTVYTLVLDNNVGKKDFLVTKGQAIGITYADVFLSLNLNAKNPFEFEDYAIQSHDNGNVFLGISVNL